MASNEITVGNSISGPSHETLNPRDTFFRIDELLMTMADTVDCRDELTRLCLVNKAFNDAFSRKLYRQLRFTVRPGLSQRLRLLLQTTKLDATQYLCFEKKANGGEDQNVDFQELLPIVGQLLHKTPALRGIHWSHASGVDILHLVNEATDPSDYPLSSLRTIINSPTLPPPLDPYPVPGRLRMPWKLTNLTSLVLVHLGYCNTLASQDFVQWFSDKVEDMAQVLTSCPKLVYLELSVAKNCLDENPRLSTFFPRICEKYHEQGSSPLELETIKLGLGMLLVSEYKNGEAAYLQDLTRTQYLKNLKFETKGVAILNAWLGNEGKAVMQIAWGTVSPENTPSLVYLHIDQLDQAGCKYLLSGEMPALLRNTYLWVKEKDVLGTDDEDGEQADSDDPKFSCVTDLFSDKLERPLQTCKLSIAIDGRVLQTKAPRSWLKLKGLSLTLSVPQSIRAQPLIANMLNTFNGLATRFLLGHASITNMILQLLVTPRQHDLLMCFPRFYRGTVHQSLVSVAKTCQKLREFTLIFGLTDPDGVPVRHEARHWRVKRHTEKGKADVEVILVERKWLQEPLR
ncbi:hypothetical protein VMCG_10174 [Cytospora schulzeri]|uniref:Uncharacterized protein n=1 Tax=Cytospora schulzeri TaxID=448051 RepID=A0A423VD03_9PEZI|nr:hypothetical protein VMCG_10174 [Valsa malicola]